MTDNAKKIHSGQSAQMNSVPIHRREEGYIDIQMSPVLLGALILVITVHAIAIPESRLTASSVGPYVLTILALLLFGFGIYANLVSLRYEASPLNQHGSPLLILALVFGSLAYSMWKLYALPFDLLFYMLVAAVVAAIIEIIYLVSQIPDPSPEE